MLKLETVQKVTSQVLNTCAIIKKDIEDIDLEDLIDYGAMMNAIHKEADVISKLVKSSLLAENIITKKKIEADGTLYRARYSERENSSIDPVTFMGEVDPADFYACIKVGMKEAKEILDDKKLNSIKKTEAPTKQVSFQKRG